MRILSFGPTLPACARVPVPSETLVATARDWARNLRRALACCSFFMFLSLNKFSEVGDKDLAPAFRSSIETYLRIVTAPGDVRIYPQYICIRQTPGEDETKILFNLLFDVYQPDRDFLALDGKWLLRIYVRNNMPAIFVETGVPAAVNCFAEHPEVRTIVTETAEFDPVSTRFPPNLCSRQSMRLGVSMSALGHKQPPIIRSILSFERLVLAHTGHSPLDSV